MKKLCILLAAVPLSACATTSFAPPGVHVKYKDVPTGTALGHCSKAAGGSSDRTIEVNRDVVGALLVVETYIEAFDCDARAAAEGRQLFEIPAFIATTGAALLGALGKSPDLAIGGGVAGSLFNAGKSYYDPKAKAAFYAHAVDALRCIRNEAVGIDNFQSFKTGEGTGETKFLDPPEVSAQLQYFIMVTDAAGAVSLVLGERLSGAGSLNAASTAAELKKIVEDIQAAKKAKEDAAKDKPVDGGDPAAKANFAANTRNWQQRMVDLDLKEMHKKLQECIWRAKV